jgi:hypothetical protein
MRRPATFFPIFLLTIGALVLAPTGAARADAPGEGPIEIDKCQTISQPGSYRLVNNIHSTTNGVPGGNCLVITAITVTIDLAGFSIGTDRGTGVSAVQGTRGITVRNGSMSASRGAAVALDGDGSIVEGLRIDLTEASGISAKGIVRGNTVTNFDGGDTGISASGSITDNYVSGMTVGVGGGLRLDTGISAEGTVRGNTVLNCLRGLIVSPGSTVIGNTATDTVTGIEANCPANLTDNTAVNNGTNLVLSGSGCNNTNNVAP